jgi:molecular chaperone DnaK (HSP70)
VAVIGIDLGTTNSSVSVWRNGELVLVPNSMGVFLTPSVVGFDNNGDIVVGAIAYSLAFIMVILFLFVLAGLYDGELLKASVFAIAFVSVGVFSSFVLKENKYAFYAIWPYAALLLFIFPIGTYVGGTLLYNLVMLKGKEI